MRFSLARTWLMTAFVAAALSAGWARAGQIYIEGASSELATLDPTTGAITPIGSTSVPLGGLGFGPSGILYGLGFDSNLYSVNTSTAALTLIGPYTGNFSGGFAFGSASDGTLYGVNGNGNIWTVNPTSGAATSIGYMYTNTNSNPSGDGGFEPLYHQSKRSLQYRSGNRLCDPDRSRFLFLHLQPGIHEQHDVRDR